MAATFAKFDVKSVPFYSTIIMFGRQISVVQHILRNHVNIPHSKVISSAEEYSTEATKEFIDHQREAVKQNHVGGDTRGALVLNECLQNDDWVSDPHIKFAFLNGRRYNVLLILAFRSAVSDVPPLLRCNTDYVIICREESIARLKTLHEQYAHMFDSFEHFSSVLAQMTSDGGCMVIHYGANSLELTDMVFWWNT